MPARSLLMFPPLSLRALPRWLASGLRATINGKGHTEVIGVLFEPLPVCFQYFVRRVVLSEMLCRGVLDLGMLKEKLQDLLKPLLCA